MKAIIFADSEASDMKPLDFRRPVCMIRVLGRPLISFLLERLKADNIDDITVVLRSADPGTERYLKGEKVKAVSGKAAAADGEPALVIFGVPFTALSLARVIDFHNKSGSEVTALKTDGGEDAGIYVFSFAEGIVDCAKMKERAIKKSVPCYTGEFFMKIEAPEDIIAFQKAVFDKKIYLPSFENAGEKGVVTGENTCIKAGAAIIPPVYIGDGTVIEAHAEIGPYASVGADSVIESGCRIFESSVGDGCLVESNAVLSGCIADSRVKIRRGARMDSFSVAGEGSVISEGCRLDGRARVWPFASTRENETVFEKVVPDTRRRVPAFCADGTVSCELSDLTPFAAARLGECFCLLKNRGKIITACDGSAEAVMIKAALSSGISAAGGSVTDIKESLACVVRCAVGHYNADGGIYIYMKDKPKLAFYGADGCDIGDASERKLEALYERDCSAPVGNVCGISDSGGFNRSYFERISENFTKFEKNMFIYFDSGAKSVCEYMEYICRATGIKEIKIGKKFPCAGNVSAKISPDGQELTLYDEDGSLLTDEELFMLSLLVISRDKMLKTAVLPKGSGKKLESFAAVCSSKTVFCGGGYPEFVRTMLKSGDPRQLLMFTDRVYALARICAYISYSGETLRGIRLMLPHAFRTVKSPMPGSADGMEELIRKTAAKYKNYLSGGGGIRIFLGKGCVLIVPDRTGNGFTVISEGFDEEYSKELCKNPYKF